MSKVVNFVGMGHVNIVVDDIDKGIEFYKKLFSAMPYQIFRNFSNVGFSKAAGFLEEPEKVKLHIAFLDIPDTGLTLELMQYVTPATVNRVVRNDVSDIAGVRHVALKVQDIESAFNHVSSVEGIKLINENIAYKPYKIDDITRTDW
ncbi:MAG: VOC family protein [Lachnospiraceae bacterium]|nr:VOC family protein [Lachnospiraceae bacterium]